MRRSFSRTYNSLMLRYGFGSTRNCEHSVRSSFDKRSSPAELARLRGAAGCQQFPRITMQYFAAHPRLTWLAYLRRTRGIPAGFYRGRSPRYAVQVSMLPGIDARTREERWLWSISREYGTVAGLGVSESRAIRTHPGSLCRIIYLRL